MSFLQKLSAKLSLKGASEKPEFYFGLNIGLSEVNAMVWEIKDHKLTIFGEAFSKFGAEEDLIEKANLALDDALGSFEVEPNKILFGVPSSWTLDDELKPQYLKLLSRMVKEYGLEPLAYVTSTHAIAHLLQKMDGIPPTSILLGISEEFVEVTLLRGGKSVESRNAKRSDHLFDNIEKTLMEFSEVEVLPSKILLFANNPNLDLDKIRDDLISYPWMQQLSFLHFPKIEKLQPGIAGLAVAFAGAIELDPGIDCKALGRKNSDESRPARLAKFSLVPSKNPLRAPSEKKKFKRTFALNRMNQESGPQESSDESLLNLDEDQEIGRAQGGLPIALPLGKISEILTKRMKILTKLPFKGPAFSKILIPVIPLLIFLAAYINFVKAEITLFTEPKVSSKEAQVIADPETKVVNEAANVIPAGKVEVTVSGISKGNATGQKQIGNSARGQAVIYNLTDQVKSFSQGTTLVGPGKLSFSLDAPVTIASQSATLGADYKTVLEPGKSSAVGITALDIGPDSNLPAATELILSSFPKSQFVVRVDQALSGGTSKTISVVTADDQKKLQVQVLDDLRQKAEEQLKAKLTGNQKIIADALSVVDAKYSFNKTVNDQASEFSVNATGKFKGTTYNDDDLKAVVSKLVKLDVPDGFMIDLANSDTQTEVLDLQKDGKLVFKAKFRAKLLPKLDLNMLRSSVRGKPSGLASNSLKKLNNVVAVEIRFTPNVPKSLAILPFLDKNLNFVISPR